MYMILVLLAIIPFITYDLTHTEKTSGVTDSQQRLDSECPHIFMTTTSYADALDSLTPHPAHVDGYELFDYECLVLLLPQEDAKERHGSNMPVMLIPEEEYIETATTEQLIRKKRQFFKQNDWKPWSFDMGTLINDHS